MNFLQEQFDFIHFLAGFGFLLLGATCLSLAKGDGKRLPWSLLGFFAAFQALSAWITPLTEFVGNRFSLTLVQIGIEAISFLFLIEFGRAGFARVRGKGPGRWIFALFGAGLLTGGLVGGIGGFDIFSRFALGSTGCVWAAITVFIAAGGLAPGIRRPLRASGIPVALLIVPIAASFHAHPLSITDNISLADLAEIPDV